MDLNDLKKYVFQKCVSHCRSKMQLLENAMSEQKESLFNETKSSAGDKYETGRAMVHLEMEKLSRQNAELRNMLSILQSVDIENVKKTAELGALVKTNQGLYFIAASIGKLEHL